MVFLCCFYLALCVISILLGLLGLSLGLCGLVWVALAARFFSLFLLYVGLQLRLLPVCLYLFHLDLEFLLLLLLPGNLSRLLKVIVVSVHVSQEWPSEIFYLLRINGFRDAEVVVQFRQVLGQKACLLLDLLLGVSPLRFAQHLRFPAGLKVVYNLPRFPC